MVVRVNPTGTPALATAGTGEPEEESPIVFLRELCAAAGVEGPCRHPPPAARPVLSGLSPRRPAEAR